MVLRKRESRKQKTTLLTKVVGQKKKEEVKKGKQQLRKTPFSFVICYNCGG